MQGNPYHPNASLAPYHQVNASQSQPYSPKVEDLPPPMHPPQSESHQTQAIQPPPLSNMGGTSPAIISNFIYGHNSQLIFCQHCSKEAKTDVKKSVNCYQVYASFSWCVCLVGAAGCCLIPFCLPKNYDAVHTCSICKREVGKFIPYFRLGTPNPFIL